MSHAQLPDQPSEENHHDENDKRRHDFFFWFECRLTPGVHQRLLRIALAVVWSNACQAAVRES
jgi:hypothetical protein